MSVSATATAATYNGNNSTSTGYAVTFPYLDPAHVKVKKTLTATGVSTTLTGGGVDFTLVEVGVGSPYVRTTVAIPTSYRVSVYRETPITQPLTLPSAGPFEAQSVERAFDRIVYQIQEKLTSLGGTLHLSDPAATAAPIPNTANTLVGFSSLGATKNYTAAELRDLILGLGVTTLSGNTKTWADETARAAISPDFVGQIGVQRDDASIWYAYALGGSYWNRYLYFKSWATADDRNSTTPDGPNQIGIQASDNTLWVSNIDLDDPGTLWKPYNHGPIALADQAAVDAAVPDYENQLAINTDSGELLRASGTEVGDFVPVRLAPNPPTTTARSPQQIAGLVGLYTPSTTVTKDGSDRCTQWNDASGANNHLTQSTAADGPVVIAASGGTPRLMRFNATKHMVFPAWDLSYSGTILIVAKKDAVDNAGVIYAAATDPGNKYLTFPFSNNAAIAGYGHSATYGTSPRRPYAYDTLAIIGATWGYEWSSNASSTYPFLRNNIGLNGVWGSVGSPITGLGTTDLTPGYLGGNAGLGIYRFDGDVYEVAVWDRRLTAQEIADVEAYYADLYDVSAYSRQPNIVFDGDSITAGDGVYVGTQAYPGLILMELGTNYGGANLAQGGTRFGYYNQNGITARAPNSVDRWVAEDNVLVIFAGTNNLANNDGATATLAAFNDYIAKRRAAGWRRIVAVTTIWRDTVAVETGRVAYNQGIRDGALTGHYIVADAAAHTAFDATPDATKFLDGVHPTTDGHIILKQVIKPAILEALSLP